MKKEKPEKKFKITVSINKQPVTLSEYPTAEYAILHIAGAFKSELERKLHCCSLSYPPDISILESCSKIDALITDVMNIEDDTEKVKTFQDKIIEILFLTAGVNSDEIFKNVIARLTLPVIDLGWSID